ncbi:amino acid permease [Candidatus Micrarchaeota archaeon]|nr:amino acid permease [Candidatus Micrarchaeota archaeon]
MAKGKSKRGIANKKAGKKNQIASNPLNPSVSNQNHDAKLSRSLNLFDATSIEIGAVIGAGIFVVIGVLAGVAGSGLVYSLIIAGIISYITGLSYMELSRRIPKEGGEYEYAYKVISHKAGFLDGILWSGSAIISGAAVSLGFASYFVYLFPLFNDKIIAFSLIIFLMFLNLSGLRKSSYVNNALVIAKVFVLLFFILLGFGYMKPVNFSYFLEFGWDGVLEGAALIFFAYAGFGRSATIAEEINEPKKTIPQAIFWGLSIITLIYVLTGITALGLLGSASLANSSAPIADAIKVTGNEFALIIITLGALAATSSVLLTELLGISRVLFSMGRNKQMPDWFSIIHPKFQTPYNAILFSGIAMSVVVFFTSFKHLIALSSFGLLGYYAITNLSALLLHREHESHVNLLNQARALIGLLSCIGLMLYLLGNLLKFG